MHCFKEGANCENTIAETHREKNKVLLVVLAHTVVNPTSQPKRERMQFP